MGRGFPRTHETAAPGGTLRRVLPVGLESVDQFAQAVATVRELRGDSRAPYDIAVELPPGSDVEPYAKAGATWLMTGLDPGVSVADVRAVIREGPAA